MLISIFVLFFIIAIITMIIIIVKIIIISIIIIIVEVQLFNLTYSLILNSLQSLMLSKYATSVDDFVKAIVCDVNLLSQ